MTVQRIVQEGQRLSHPGSFLSGATRLSMFSLCSHVPYNATQGFFLSLLQRCERGSRCGLEILMSLNTGCQAPFAARR
jgi:hypothetical protein